MLPHLKTVTEYQCGISNQRDKGGNAVDLFWVQPSVDTELTHCNANNNNDILYHTSFSYTRWIYEFKKAVTCECVQTFLHLRMEITWLLAFCGSSSGSTCTSIWIVLHTPLPSLYSNIFVSSNIVCPYLLQERTQVLHSFKWKRSGMHYWLYCSEAQYARRECKFIPKLLHDLSPHTDHCSRVNRIWQSASGKKAAVKSAALFYLTSTEGECVARFEQ